MRHKENAEYEERSIKRIFNSNITKKEWVLDGATVLYGSASELK